MHRCGEYFPDNVYCFFRLFGVLDQFDILFEQLLISNCPLASRFYQFVEDSRHLLVILEINEDFLYNFFTDVVFNSFGGSFFFPASKFLALCLYEIQQGKVIELAEFTTVIRFDVISVN